MARREEAVQLYDERFARMWEFYLACSEMSFRKQNMMNFQIQLTKRQGVVPITRDYIAQRGGKTAQHRARPAATAADRRGINRLEAGCHFRKVSVPQAVSRGDVGIWRSRARELGAKRGQDPLIARHCCEFPGVTPLPWRPPASTATIFHRGRISSSLLGMPEVAGPSPVLPLRSPIRKPAVRSSPSCRKENRPCVRCFTEGLGGLS